MLFIWYVKETNKVKCLGFWFCLRSKGVRNLLSVVEMQNTPERVKVFLGTFLGDEGEKKKGHALFTVGIKGICRLIKIFWRPGGGITQLVYPGLLRTTSSLKLTSVT